MFDFYNMFDENKMKPIKQESEPRHLIVLGAGGFAREVLSFIKQDYTEYSLVSEGGVGYCNDVYDLDDLKSKGLHWAYNHPRRGIGGNFLWDKTNQELKDKNTDFVAAIGDPHLKQKLKEKAEKILLGKKLNFPAFIDEKAIVRTRLIGRGVIICAGTVITHCLTKIHDHVTLNLNVTVGHDVEIDRFTTVAPGVNISGNVKIGKFCDIGSNAVILPGVKLPPNGVIGAGAVVTEKSLELPKGFTWDQIQSYVIVGNPGKIIKINGERV